MKNIRAVLSRWKIEWNSTSLDRKIELFFIGGGIVVAALVLINGSRQLEQMAVQTNAMQGQLAEMKSGGEDTKTIANSAKTQADNMKALAEAAIEQVKQLQAGVKETHDLAVATQESLRLAREQFNKGMRPFVRVVKTKGPSFKVGQKAGISIYYTNIGKLPAMGLRVYRKLITGEKAAEFAKGQETAITSEFFKRKAKIADAGETLMAGEPADFFTLLSDSVLTDADVEYIKRHDAGWAVLVFIEYFDYAGSYYFTEVCRFGLVTGAIAHCNNHNK